MKVERSHEESNFGKNSEPIAFYFCKYQLLLLWLLLLLCHASIYVRLDST